MFIEYKNSEIALLIDDMIHSARDRRILKMRYIDGFTYERIAEDTEMSVRQVQNIIYRHENTVFSGLS